MEKWKLSQVFGEDPTQLNEGNVITSVEFDPSGEYLAVGYYCGQVVVFKRGSGDSFQFYTQFESHESEFDCLTSLEIEEKITNTRWAKNLYRNNSRMLFTSNDKTIKLWRMYEKKEKKLKLSLKELKISDDPPKSAPQVQCRRVFSNAHAYNINSISMCSDGELFISADDLRINLWSIENNKESFTVVDTKPTNMEELNEVITSAEFHPTDCSTFIYTSSAGALKMCDMRQQALCDRVVKRFVDKKQTTKSFFAEIINSTSDVKYSRDGRYVLTRDYLSLKVWDVNMEAEPIKRFTVNDRVKSKLYELYENDGIFDKFECAFSHNDLGVLTGSYSNTLQVHDIIKGDVQWFQCVNPKERNKKSNTLPPETLNFDEKVLHVAWHPTTSLVAIVAGNYLYFYHTTGEQPN